MHPPASSSARSSVMGALVRLSNPTSSTRMTSTNQQARNALFGAGQRRCRCEGWAAANREAIARSRWHRATDSSRCRGGGCTHRRYIPQDPNPRRQGRAEPASRLRVARHRVRGAPPGDDRDRPRTTSRFSVLHRQRTPLRAARVGRRDRHFAPRQLSARGCCRRGSRRRGPTGAQMAIG